MKNKKQSYKPYKIIDGYRMRKQLRGGYKIEEFSHFSNEDFLRKRVIARNLTMSEAEAMLYELEK